VSALSPILRAVEGGGLRFHCPGCAEAHLVYVGAGDGPRWGYNGDPDRPTFTPSVLVRSGHYVEGRKAPDGAEPMCWCSYEARTGEKPGFSCYVCHSFVVDGRIQFLADCTHALAGQTVDLPAWPEAEAAETEQAP
jgi:hypothetical protein